MSKKERFSSSQNTVSGLDIEPRLSGLLREVAWLLQITLGVFLALSLLSHYAQDPSWTHAVQTSSIENWLGLSGAWISDAFLFLFGVSAYWWVVVIVRKAIVDYRYLVRAKQPDFCELPQSRLSKIISGLSFITLLISSSGIESLRFYSWLTHLPDTAGGVMGHSVAKVISGFLGFTGGTLFLLLLFTLSLSLFFQFSWLNVVERIGGFIFDLWDAIRHRRESKRDRHLGELAASHREGSVEQIRAKLIEHEPVQIMPPVIEIQKSQRIAQEQQLPLFVDERSSVLPPLSLLDAAPAVQDTISSGTLEFTSRLIEKKLKDFGVEATVIAAYPGPVITRYEIEPAIGVKGSQIVNLAKDLARSLSLISIRVVETIPGKNYMGLELPNQRRQSIALAEILGSVVYNDMPSVLALGLGKDIGGKPIVVDLSKMPHLLVAGTTGSGKSVGINAMLLSLLYKAAPEKVRLILIDPKMLEMSVYDEIPHLLCPVVTDMRQAGHALNWAVAEMERRYKLMSKLGVRNLAGYNHRIEEAKKRGENLSNPFSLTPETPEPLEKLPYIVIVIDELADLMMVVGKKVEELIARIAQKARAAGMHLILATQRPSVDVITGLIKANIPTRIAFQVSSKIDSRTILDQQGAEALLGMGDMLYLAPGMGLPTRVHGAFVSDEEVHRVVKHLRKQGRPDYIEGLLTGEAILGDADSDAHQNDSSDAEKDDLYDQAVAIVLKNRRASISLVQRHLRIGYNRAARLLEQMEKTGIVSTMASNGNREVLVPPSQNLD